MGAAVVTPARRRQLREGAQPSDEPGAYLCSEVRCVLPRLDSRVVGFYARFSSMYLSIYLCARLALEVPLSLLLPCLALLPYLCNWTPVVVLAVSRPVNTPLPRLAFHHHGTLIAVRDDDAARATRWHGDRRGGLTEHGRCASPRPSVAAACVAAIVMAIPRPHNSISHWHQHMRTPPNPIPRSSECWQFPAFRRRPQSPPDVSRPSTTSLRPTLFRWCETGRR